MKTLTELGLDRYKAAELCKKQQCGECDGILVLAWGGLFGINDYIIRCGNDIDHSTFKREYKQIINPYAKITMKEVSKLANGDVERTKVLAKYRGSSIVKLNKEEAMEILRTIYPGAPDKEIIRAAIYCRDYGLNPIRGHVALVPYKNTKTGETDWVITQDIKAKRLIAVNSGGAYDYLDDTPRSASDEEVKRSEGKIIPGRVYGICILKDIKTGATARAVRWINEQDSIKGADKGNSHINMARIRAEAAALDMLHPGQMAGDGIVTVDESEMPEIDVETGEITEPSKIIVEGKAEKIESPKA